MTLASGRGRLRLNVEGSGGSDIEGQGEGRDEDPRVEEELRDLRWARLRVSLNFVRTAAVEKGSTTFIRNEECFKMEIVDV